MPIHFLFPRCCALTSRPLHTHSVPSSEYNIAATTYFTYLLFSYQLTCHLFRKVFLGLPGLGWILSLSPDHPIRAASHCSSLACLLPTLSSGFVSSLRAEAVPSLLPQGLARGLINMWCSMKICLSPVTKVTAGLNWS